VVSIVFFLLWQNDILEIGLAIGSGIFAYGLSYFLVHDIFIHQRFKFFRNANNVYAKGVRRAHKMHHKHTGKEDGECFGMLFVPFKYFKNKNVPNYGTFLFTTNLNLIIIKYLFH